MDRELYPEEIWEAIQRHPSGREAELNQWARSVIEQDADDWADFLEDTFDPDSPHPLIDRIEDMET